MTFPDLKELLNRSTKAVVLRGGSIKGLFRGIPGPKCLQMNFPPVFQ